MQKHPSWCEHSKDGTALRISEFAQEVADPDWCRIRGKLEKDELARHALLLSDLRCWHAAARQMVWIRSLRNARCAHGFDCPSVLRFQMTFVACIGLGVPEPVGGRLTWASLAVILRHGDG